MFSLIRRLQQKPEPHRRAIALWTALGVTVGIFMLWLVSFFVRLGTVETAAERQEQQVSPVESISEMISSFSTIFKEQL